MIRRRSANAHANSLLGHFRDEANPAQGCFRFSFFISHVGNELLLQFRSVTDNSAHYKLIHGLGLVFSQFLLRELPPVHFRMQVNRLDEFS